MKPGEKAAQREAELQAQWERMRVYEEQLQRQGLRWIAGLDEAGRGPLAGPVAAAAVILPADAYLPGLNDSKQLSEKRRLQLEQEIKKIALAWCCRMVDHNRIDQINILNAAKQAMAQAVQGLRPRPEFLLIDGNMELDVDLPQRGIVKGDRLSVSIAAASIIAKCTRDRFMLRMEQLYPGYQFAKHKGYPTALHKQNLAELGPSPIHRKTFHY